jgi:transcriptional regulator with XRE-family HTH domain
MNHQTEDELIRLVRAEEVLSPGFQIRSARKDQGLTLVELAAESGTTHGRICALEAGENHSNPTIKTLRTIARSLGFRISVEFVSDKNLIAQHDSFPFRRDERLRDFRSKEIVDRIIEAGKGTSRK